MKKLMKRIGAGLVAGAGTLSGHAMAAIDTTGVQTALDASVSSAESVGTLVIGAVAGLVVIALIIGIVKKLSA